MAQDTKVKYEAPKLVQYGTVTALTSTFLLCSVDGKPAQCDSQQ